MQLGENVLIICLSLLCGRFSRVHVCLSLSRFLSLPLSLSFWPSVSTRNAFSVGAPQLWFFCAGVCPKLISMCMRARVCVQSNRLLPAVVKLRSHVCVCVCALGDSEAKSLQMDRTTMKEGFSLSLSLSRSCFPLSRLFQHAMSTQLGE